MGLECSGKAEADLARIGAGEQELLGEVSPLGVGQLEKVHLVKSLDERAAALGKTLQTDQQPGGGLSQPDIFMLWHWPRRVAQRQERIGQHPDLLRSARGEEQRDELRRLMRGELSGPHAFEHLLLVATWQPGHLSRA